MATSFDKGQPTFGLRQCIIAVNNLDGTFGTAVQVPSIKIYNVDYKTVSAELEGDDTITATAAIATKADCDIQFGGITMSAYQVLTGINPTSSGSGSGYNAKMLFAATNFPYFAILGQAYAAQGGGDTHIFVPKVKIMSGFSLKMEFGQFTIPDVKATAVLDPNYNAIFSAIEHGTITAAAIPPTF